jgi:hypothetical protein
MEKTKRVYIYKVDEALGIDGYRVFPGLVVLEKNEEVEFRNLSGKEATVKVKDGLVGAPFTDKIADKGSKTKKAKDTEQPLVTEYEVIVDGKKAKGNSDPVIIIDT